MAIALKPQRTTHAISPKKGEQAAEHFIASVEAKQREDLHTKTIKKTPVMLRFDVALLDKVDTTARRRGISRSAWIQYVISFCCRPRLRKAAYQNANPCHAVTLRHERWRDRLA